MSGSWEHTLQEEDGTGSLSYGTDIMLEKEDSSSRGLGVFLLIGAVVVIVGVAKTMMVSKQVKQDKPNDTSV